MRGDLRFEAFCRLGTGIHCVGNNHASHRDQNRDVALKRSHCQHGNNHNCGTGRNCLFNSRDTSHYLSGRSNRNHLAALQGLGPTGQANAPPQGGFLIGQSQSTSRFSGANRCWPSGKIIEPRITLQKVMFPFPIRRRMTRIFCRALAAAFRPRPPAPIRGRNNASVRSRSDQKSGAA